MAKISFDFDSTLDQLVIQELAKFFIKEGHEVWIVSSRMDKVQWNRDLYRVADNLGISRNRIYLTNGDYKFKYLQREKFDFHFDDDFMELQTARENFCKCIFIPVYDPNEIIEQI